MAFKRFLIFSKNTDKSGYIWNMLGSMLNAFQSVILLIFITRFADLDDAGIFTIAFINANFFLNIGKYGMRNFQVSDTNTQFCFNSYRVSRYITTVIMLVIFFLYIAVASQVNNYSYKKSLIIILVCVLKSVDSIEDVYHGLFQQNNRLDVAGKNLSIRMIITMLAFSISIIMTRSLFIAVTTSIIVTFILYILLNSYCYFSLKDSLNSTKDKATKKEIIYLLRICLPLFISVFLSFYIGNAPKYSIDTYMTNEAQAIFGFISMPIFIIGLLNSFVFNPVISKMAFLWNNGEIKNFKKMIRRHFYIIILISLFCELVTYLIGIELLSFMYNTDLSDYKSQLLILLLGGGFLALSGLLVTILTIMRKQKFLAFGYIFVSIFSFVLSPLFVKRSGITGASIIYLLLMIVLCIVFYMPIFYIVNTTSKKQST